MTASDHGQDPVGDGIKSISRGLQKTRGDAGELAVAHYLQAHGFSLLAHQYLVPRLGEIDLVMKKGSCLYFIEVKARSGTPSYGSGLEQITPKKIAKIRKAALAYCQNTGNMNSQTRILAAEVHLQNGEPSGDIRIVPI
ncbi:MAG: YraN family protein [Clostridia bacterium]|nr:YraN family protein [Clostridia bacterium]NCC74968.1 YraN family protein [Clostridia bacterium]